LCAAIRDVLAEGLKYKGTTLRDYVDGDGRTGMFQERLQVYGREGEPCPRCGGAVARVVLGGRSSFHCPRCQVRSEEHTSELQSREKLVCRLLLEKKKH